MSANAGTDLPALAGAAARPVAPARRRPFGWAGLVLVLPALLLYLGFVVYPMIASFLLSLTDWDGVSAQKTFVGLQNYRRIFFEDPVARTALRNNAIWGAFAITVPTGVGLGFALLLNRRFKGRVIFRAIFYGPSILPLVATALIWTWAFNPNFGLINETLRFLGLGALARPWLSQVETALPSILLTALWQGAGFPMLLYLAALQAIPREQYEAGAIDGASRWQTFRSITLPWLKEVTVVVMTLNLINSLKAFELVYAMTFGGPSRSTQTLATWMYFNSFPYNHPGYGSALAWLIAAASMLIAIPYIRMMARRS
jgi:raffinose/stachyose/melibiose transport system permease protein